MSFTPLGPTIGSLPPPLPIADGGTGAATPAAGLAALGGLVQQASVALAGFALQNGTPTIITWTPPNDGALHRFVVIGTTHITGAETGGALSANFTKPDGSASNAQIDAGGHAAGGAFQLFGGICQAGQPVSVVQSSALTLGAALQWADIWGI